jgi:uncharacterized membrane protein
MKQKWQLIVFCLIHILTFTIIFNSNLYVSEGHYGTSLYFNYSSRVVALGQLPYQDFAVEYPPLALIFLTLPRLIAPNPATYANVFAIEILLFDLLGLFLISALSRRLNLSLWKTLAIYTLALLAIGPIIAHRYDLIPAIIVLLALYTFSQGKHKTSWALLAMGVMTKIYPVILAPIFLLYHWRHRQNRQAIVGVATFAITTAVIMAPFLLLSPDGLWNSFSYHAQRGLQCESTYSSFLLLGQTLGLTSVEMEFSFGSLNITSPLADILAKVSPLVMLFSLVAVYWFFYKSQSEPAVAQQTPSLLNQPDTARIVSYSLVAMLAFMLTNKVLSPQFIIWLYPLIPLVVGRWRRISWLMFILIGLMTYLVYPLAYDGIRQGHPLVISILFMRNVSLITLAFLLPYAGNRLQPKLAR